MPDHKTVTFDAIREAVGRITEVQRRSGGPAWMEAKGLLANDLTFIAQGLIDALAAAPTPAAQSAGQEVVAWAVFDSVHMVSTVVDPASRKAAECAGYTLRPLVFGDAAPVNGSNNVDEIALRSRWNCIANSDDMFEQFMTEVRALLACAAPVNGGERADIDRLVRELDVLLNGDSAAKQASLCDVVSQVRSEQIRSAKFLPLLADPPQAIGDHDIRTSTGGRAFVAEFFARRLKRHDFGRYIKERLAADFACALAKYLSEMDAADAQQVGDRKVLHAILEHLDGGISVCERCRYEESTRDMDVTADLRSYLNGGDSWLAKTAALTSPAKESELEMHQADYASIKAAGFQDPGELLDAYLRLTSPAKADDECPHGVDDGACKECYHAKVGGDEREAFERWYEAAAMPAESDWFKRETDDPSEYAHGETHSAWLAWQARAALSADGGDLKDAERWRKFLRIYTYYRWSLFDSPEEVIREVDETVVDPASIPAKAKGDA
ncbi:hypothetical protein PCO31110_01636 [Pandoraea communis]|uniref:Uncharacterized protein n=1 Tax=Pandoraea communis TaxID=2508297 RepID=A0A5E4TU11_9BURK|nr:hypothetical protein [Pandoraea communis]VVD91350.1 hypothetical protein PCO31110_01636 [Pandoraea communis]